MLTTPSMCPWLSITGMCLIPCSSILCARLGSGSSGVAVIVFLVMCFSIGSFSACGPFSAIVFTRSLSVNIPFILLFLSVIGRLPMLCWAIFCAACCSVSFGLAYIGLVSFIMSFALSVGIGFVPL